MYVCTRIYIYICMYVQVTLRITPLKEGELTVKGFIFNLCMESGPFKPPLNLGNSKANALSLSLSSRDTLYQVMSM